MNKGKKIAGVTRQRVGQLMRTLFQILLEHPDGIQAQLVEQPERSVGAGR